MDTMEMVPHTRQLADVTRDIRRQAGQLVAAGIEIGRLLFEAKEMVPHGQWGEYIKEELPFSHSWANNYMRLYKEYGQAQYDLFAPDAAKVAGLTVSKALALLEMPEEARQGFLEQHDVEAMSTRELEKAIRERNAAENRVGDLEDELESVRMNLETARAETRDERMNYEAQKARAEVAEDQARKKAEELEKLTRKYTDAKNAEADAKRQLKRLKERPEIPEGTMEALRKQVEADELAKATAKVEAELAQAKEELEIARAEAEQARQTAEESVRKLVQSQKEAKFQNPDILAVQLLSQKLVEDWSTIQDHRVAATKSEPIINESLKNFLKAVLDKMLEDLK